MDPLVSSRAKLSVGALSVGDAEGHSSDTTAITRAGLVSILLLGGFAWWLEPQPYIADDSYFYLVVARNLALSGHAWLVARVVGMDALWNEAFAWPLSLLFVSLGAWLWSKATRLIGLNSLVLAGIPVAFLVSLGVLGSEAHAQFFFTSLLVLSCVSGRATKSPRWAMLSGIAAGLMVLARLDLLFLAATLSVFTIGGTGSLLRFSFYTVGGAIVVVPYLASNLILYGGVMPVSGWMKSGFPQIHLSGLHIKGLATDLSGCSVAFGIVPVLVALLVASTRGSESARASLLLRAFAAASVLHLGYIAIFTRSHTDWYWYYVLTVTTGALGLAVFVRRQHVHSRKMTAVLALALVILVGASAVARLDRDASPPQAAGLAFIEKLNIGGDAVLVSDWPGFLAFKTTAKVVAADMLTSNRNFYEPMRQTSNALDFILEVHAREGAPIRAVLYLGNSWLVPNADASAVAFNDPRAYPDLQPIGHLTLGHPTATSDAGRFLAWSLPPR